MTPQTPTYYSYIPYALIMGGIAIIVLLVPRMRTLSVASGSSQIHGGLNIGSFSNDSGNKEQEIDAMDVVMKLLNENERLIVNKLLESGDDMLQKDLSSELDLSPVKIHRAIVNLKEKGIITSEKHFNTNKISLDMSFFDYN